jgi:hypothetical protein
MRRAPTAPEDESGIRGTPIRPFRAIQPMVEGAERPFSQADTAGTMEFAVGLHP